MALQIRIGSDTMLDVVRRAALPLDPAAVTAIMDTAEDIKKELSVAEWSARVLPVGGARLSFQLSRSDFEDLLELYLVTMRDSVEIMIDDSRSRFSDISKVIMAGGSSNIRAFQKLFADLCGHRPVISSHPQEDVACGAAIFARTFATS
jgi:molecular chaperone DnaK